MRALVDEICGVVPGAADELLASLDADQRRGRRALPDPLPRIPALDAYARTMLPCDAEPDRVLVLALCGSGPLHALCNLEGCQPEDIATSPSVSVVQVMHGRFRFGDLALRAHVIAAATPQERLRAHQELAAVLAAAGDEDAALWHRARGAVTEEPALVDGLLAQAEHARRDADTARARLLAAEAVDHAVSGSPAAARALLAAAQTGLDGGWVADAAEYAERAMRLDGPHRGAAIAVFVLAHTLCTGTVPSPDGLIPTAHAGAEYWPAAAAGAALSAERGDPERRTAWLEAGRRIAGPCDGRGLLLAWCDVLAGAPVAVEDGTGFQHIVHALNAGIAGDPDAGVRALAEPDSAGVVPDVPGERGALPRARRAVAEVLLHLWAGRIGVADELMQAAASELPVALPFGGLAVSLSRRLDLAVRGRIGTRSTDLSASVPWTSEPDGFVDRAIDAYLQGRSDEAATHLGLWADRGSPADPLGLPGLDEIGPFGADPAPEPPDATTGRLLRERIRSAREASWSTDLNAVAEESRGILSTFERARVEALLGSTCAARGDRHRGVRHLRAARSLFEASGARAWRGMVDRRLRMMAEPRRRADDEPDEGGVSRAVPFALEVCRAMWEPILTARELDVALLMAEGRANREIGLALHISVRTVEVHGGRVFAKLDVRSRHELAVLAHRTDQHL
ncbi:MAG: helix-turn-helix transcriptional regulator [Actinobacteria bacterium]|nr:helix-turn-helix transcriptional regulator [Actinomycetota bacterium]